ncbi:MAG: HEAT repeat domain-containing protein [Anaerolineae bacterium]|nr:HEAT repeat domain-containing protein [Anaerolineae bacterium]
MSRLNSPWILLLFVVVVFLCVGLVYWGASLLPSLFTSPAVPTPDLSDFPLPSPEEISARYEDEIQPLVRELRADGGTLCDKGVLPDDGFDIKFIPLTERLYYLQDALFPTLSLGDSSAVTHLYVTYEYTRGADLSAVFNGTHWINYVASAASDEIRDTQEIYVKVSLYVQNGKDLCLLEDYVEPAEVAGRTFVYDTRHRDLLRASLPVLPQPKRYRNAIADTLNGILCYAIGIDFYPSLPQTKRAALITWAVESPYWSDREQALRTLSLNGLGKFSSETLLIQTAQTDEAFIVREAAVRVLGDLLPSQDVVDTLTPIVWEDTPALSISAIYALGETGTEALPIFVEVLRDHPDGFVRSAAASQVAELGVAAIEAKPVLVAALEDESDEYVRENLVRALGAMGPDAVDAWPLLVRILKTDDNTQVRSAVAWAMSKVDTEGTLAIPELMVALRDDVNVAGSAVYALGRYGARAKAAVPNLIQVIEEYPDLGLANLAASALQSITGEDFGRDTAAWWGWWENNR